MADLDLEPENDSVLLVVRDVGGRIRSIIRRPSADSDTSVLVVPDLAENRHSRARAYALISQFPEPGGSR